MAVIDLNLKRHSAPINRNAASDRLLVFFSICPEVFSSPLVTHLCTSRFTVSQKYDGFFSFPAFVPALIEIMSDSKPIKLKIHMHTCFSVYQ